MVVLVIPPALAVIVTGVEVATPFVAIVKVALVAPAATATLAGTVAVVVLLLDKVTTVPPEGPAPVNVTVPCEVFPPTTLVGLKTMLDSVGVAVAARGVKRRAADQAPAVPAELMLCTLHQCRTAARVEGVN